MKRMMLTVMAGLMMGLVPLIAPTPSYAVVPQILPYQGQLKDAAGTPVNGVVNITFNLYDAASGGLLLWSETHTGVNITKGLFKVDLGADPANLFTPGPGGTFDMPVWLGVTIGTDPEMSPRTKLNSAPFALHADDADTVGGFSSSQLDQSAQVGTLQTNLNAHIADTTNPHGVTAAQVGADAAGAAATVQTNLDTHVANTANPHSVTAAQVGADAAGAAAAAAATVQTNLDAHVADTANPHGVTAAQTAAVAKAGDTMTGALGIGTAPAGDLDVLGQSGVLFSGTFNATGTTPLPAMGVGTRMMWFPELAAFRVGHASNSQWDKFRIGQFSVAMGVSTTASGNSSTAMGSLTTASGDASTAMGNNTTASGNSSTAMGNTTTASGSVSTAMGASTTASGQFSVAMGSFTTASGQDSVVMGSGSTANSFGELVVGVRSDNTPFAGADPLSWIATDPLFVIGNGNPGNRSFSNALVMLKNGNTTLNGTLTATAFVGDGSGLTGLPAPGASSITSAMISDGTILDADISPTAAIASSKIAGLGTLASLSTVGSTEITDGSIATADLANASVTAAKLSGVTAADVGAAAAVHTHSGADITTGTVAEARIDPLITRDTELAAHTGNTANPHNVTAAQTGAVAKAGDTMTGTLIVPKLAIDSSNTLLGVWDTQTSGGARNVAIGNWALNTNSQGSDNVAVGWKALNRVGQNAGGSANTAVGVSALEKNGTGSSTALGYHAGLDNTGGSNVFIGANAGYDGSLATSFVGSGNVFIGASAGANETGSNKLYIANNATTTLIYGDFALGRVGIGTTVPTDTLTVNGPASNTTGVWTVFSDERLKNIKGNYNAGLDAVMKLQPIVYHYKHDNPLKLPDEPEHIGFSAQALQKVIPQAVEMSSAGYLEVNSGPVYWAMLNAIKELKQQKDQEQAAVNKKLAAKDAQIAALKAKNTVLQVRLDSLDSKVEMLVRAMAASQVAQLQQTGD